MLSQPGSRGPSLKPEAALDLGTKFLLMKRRCQELERRAESASRESAELRAVVAEMLERGVGRKSRADAAAEEDAVVEEEKRSVGVQCDLQEFLGKHNVEQIAAAVAETARVSRSSSPKAAEMAQAKKGEEWERLGFGMFKGMLREAKRLVKTFSTPDEYGAGNTAREDEFDLAMFLSSRRKAAHYLFDCECVKSLVSIADQGQKQRHYEHMQMFEEFQVGHLFVFKEHIEFITPTDSVYIGQEDDQTKSDRKSIQRMTRNWKVVLLDLDEIVAVEEKVQPFPEEFTSLNQDIVVYGVRELQPQSPHPSMHLFWDIAPTNLNKGIVVLKEQLARHFIGKEANENNSADMEKVIVYENERKAVGWSGKFLMPGDPSNWCDVHGKPILTPLIDLPPPSGMEWINDSWIIDSNSFIAKVAGVEKNSPGTFAGLKDGDLVLRYHTKKYSVEWPPSYSSLLLSLQISDGSSVVLVVFRPSEHSWIHVYLRSFSWNGKSFGINFEKIDGWMYGKSFYGPWSEITSWTFIARRRKWTRFAKQCAATLDSSESHATCETNKEDGTDNKGDDKGLPVTIESNPQDSSTKEITQSSQTSPSMMSGVLNSMIVEPAKRVGAASARVGSMGYKGISGAFGYKKELEEKPGLKEEPTN